MLRTALSIGFILLIQPVSSADPFLLSTSHPEFFSSSTYLFVYLFFWNFVIELSIATVLNFKHSKWYLPNHITLNFLVLFGQLINEICLGSLFDFGNSYRVTTYLVMALTGLQIWLGRGLKARLVRTDMPKYIFVFRMSHRVVGYAVYLLHKDLIYFYAYNHFSLLNQESMIIFIYVLFGLTAVFHVTLYLFARAGVFNTWNISLKKKGPFSTEKHKEILKNLQLGEYESYAEETYRISSQEVQMKTELLSEKIIRWVLIENKVFDISEILHPKGQFIFSAIYYKDVTREIYGLKPYRFENRKLQTHKVLNHHHHLATFKNLEECCFGEFGLGELIVTEGGGSGFKEKMEDPNTEIRMSNLREEEKINLFENWTVKKMYSSAFSVCFATNDSEKVKINLCSYWLKNFGKYFLIKNEDGTKQYAYLCLALSPKYIALKKSFYAFKGIEEKYLKGNSFYDEEMESLRIACSKFALSKSQAARLSLQSRNIHDPVLPLILLKKFSILKEGARKTMVGPLGIELGFDSNTTKEVLVVLEDEGIYPFIDIFEFFSQKALLDVLGENSNHPIFGNEYMYTFANQLKLYFVLYISKGFAKQAKSLVLNSISMLSLLEKGTNGSSIKKVIEQVSVVSSAHELKSPNYNFYEEKPVEFSKVAAMATSSSEKKNIERLIVSASSGFVNCLLSNCFLPHSEVFIL